MGLILSVLVACVGVIELISFCSNVKRNLTLRPISGDLSGVRANYVQELSEVRKRRESDLQRSNNAEGSNSLNVDRPVPTFRLNSHEDIEIEYNRNVVTKSRTPSPRRFLVTEKELKDARRSPSPRQFVVSEEPQGIRKSQCQTSIPEFFIQEQKNSKKSPNHPRYVLKDQEGRSGSPIPLPSKFVITEHESGTPALAGTSSGASPTKISSNHEEYCRRSPSPYPQLDISQAPRNSICNELVDDPVVTLFEEDEDLYKSRSPSPRIVEDNVGITINFNTGSNSVSSLSIRTQSASVIQKDLLAATVIERARSKSESASKNVTTELVQKSASSSQINENEFAESTSFLQENLVENTTYDENYLNNLDGLSKQKFVKRNFSSRRTVKRLSVNNSIEEESSSKSGESCDKENTTKILAVAAEKLECDSTAANSNEPPVVASTSKEPEVKKEPEPFWLIFSGEYTKAMNKDWHGQHFCCWQCDESLTGQRYVLRDDHPYCVSCYESVFANACEKCSRIIGIDSKDLSYKDKHWHEACFLCTTCGESLVDKQFGSKGDRIYCGSCYDQQFASRCDGCHEIFRAGTKKMEYKTRQWHEKCFCCCVCKVPIGTQSFIPREQEIYCAKCYEEKFATRCIKCNKVITSGGVTYKNEPWHRECFTCTHCQKSLAGERFTSRDEKPFCAECFGELFAKRCTACNKPITGIGGTKFISFEDRHWHNDCFFCASCQTSLVGRGFITDNEDIICPECAKQKLM